MEYSSLKVVLFGKTIVAIDNYDLIGLDLLYRDRGLQEN
jgi:hypothetical protein